MMKNTKKGIAAALAIILVVSLNPFTAGADTIGQTFDISTISENVWTTNFERTLDGVPFNLSFDVTSAERKQDDSWDVSVKFSKRIDNPTRDPNILFNAGVQVYVDESYKTEFGPGSSTRVPIGGHLRYESDAVHINIPAGKSVHITSKNRRYSTGITSVGTSYFDFHLSAPTYHTVTFKDGLTGKTLKSEKVKHGEGAKAPSVPTHTGYKSNGWDHPFDSVTSDVTVTARYTPISYTVSFNANGGTGKMANQTMTYDKASTLSRNVFSKRGYTWVGWSTNKDGSGTAFANGQEVKNLSATDGATVHLYAKWRPNTYKVRFDANGGTGSMPDQAMTYDHAERLSKNAFSRRGYTWTGWSTNRDGSGTTFGDDQEVKNLTATDGGTAVLYAKWSPNTYKVRFDANGGVGKMPDQSMTYDKAEKLDANEFSRTGYTWVGWSAGADGSGTSYANRQEVLNLTVEQGGVVTLYAKWRPNRYKITFDKRSPAAEGFMPEQQMIYDAPATLNACSFTWEGHTFKGWSLAGTSYEDRQVVENLTADDGATITLHAKWDVITHPVIFTDGLGNELSREEVPHGTSATEPEHPKRVGYTFDGWNADFTNVTSPLTVDAIWKPNRYAIHFDADGGVGAMPDQTMIYDEPDKLDTCAFTRPGHEFQGWALQPGDAIAYYNEQKVINLTAKDSDTVTLFAVWDENADVRISYSATDPTHSKVSRSHEDVAPSGGKPKGSTVSVSEGYKPVGWFDRASGKPVGGDVHFKPERDGNGLWRAGTYDARIEPISYTVRFNANGGNGEMDNQVMTYDQRTALSPCKFTRPGFHFVGWSSDDNDDVEFSDGKEVMNLTAEDGAIIDLRAVWIEDPAVTITYTAEDPAHSSVTVASELLAPITGEASGSEAIVGTGYEFKRWSDWAGEVVGTESTFVPEPTSDGMWKTREYIAHIEPVSYTVRFDSNGGSGEMPDQPMTYDKTASLDECTFTRPGYRFTGWNTTFDGTGTQYKDEQEVLNLTGEKGAVVTLYAQWKKLEFTVNFHDGWGNLIATNSVPYGGKATAPAVPNRKGFEFTDWDTDFGCVTDDLDVTARWRKIDTGEATDVATEPGASNDENGKTNTAQAATDPKPLDQTGSSATILAIGALTASTALGFASMRGRREQAAGMGPRNRRGHMDN